MYLSPGQHILIMSTSVKLNNITLTLDVFYSYEYAGRFDIGSTTNLEKQRRRERAQHIRHGNTFTQAINQYGGLQK